MECGNPSERGSEQIVCGDRARDGIGVGLFEKIVVRQGQQILKGLQPDICIRAAIETAQTDAAIRRNDVRQNGVADFERVCAGDGK